MTLGKELTKQTGYNLLHNHMSIEFALQFFQYGTEGFNAINSTIRQTVFEEIAKHEPNGFIFTYMMAFNLQSEKKYLMDIADLFTSSPQDWEMYYIELMADLETRLTRNTLPDRIQAKPSKQNTELTTKRLLESNKKYQLNSNGTIPILTANWLILDTTELKVAESVNKIMDFCGIEAN